MQLTLVILAQGDFDIVGGTHALAMAEAIKVRNGSMLLIKILPTFSQFLDIE